MNRWHGFREVVALHKITPEVYEEGQLRRGLYAFGNHRQPKAAAHGENGCDDRLVLAVETDAPDKRHVDLEAVGVK